MSQPDQPDYLLLKWGTLKSWRVSSPKAQEALQEFFDLGVPASILCHHPTDRQKELLCIVIDECNGDIQEDWGGEMLSKQAGIKLTHVPYKATPEAITAVLGGHAQAAFTTGAGGLLESGVIRILAAAADQRVEGLPDIPTFKEEGFPISITSSYTFCLPKGTSKEVVDILSNAQKKAFEKYSKEIKESMVKVEVWARLMTPQETMEKYKKDYDSYYKLAEELGVLAK